MSPGDRNETELFVLVTHFSTLKDSPPCSGYFAEACDCLDYTRVRPEGQLFRLENFISRKKQLFLFHIRCYNRNRTDN